MEDDDLLLESMKHFQSFNLYLSASRMEIFLIVLFYIFIFSKILCQMQRQVFSRSFNLRRRYVAIDIEMVYVRTVKKFNYKRNGTGL